MNKDCIVFLGPRNATFSSEAYNDLAEKFGAPRLSASSSFLAADSNSNIVPILTNLGGIGYGVIAMETQAEGKVTEPIESFIGLLNSNCHLSILGAIRKRLHFALIGRPGCRPADIKKVIAHKKSLGVCRRRICDSNYLKESRGSNGLAILEVANSKDLTLAAIGPAEGAKQYGLSIIDGKFEDQKAITTFFLLGPSKRKPIVLEENRALIVFRIRHKAGSLVDALKCFQEENLSLIHIHSAYASKREYDFAIELEFRFEKISNFQRAMAKFRPMTVKCLGFGPFGISDEG